MTGLTGRVVVFFVVVVLRVVDTFLGGSVVLNGGFLVVTSISFVVTWLSFSSVIVFRRPLIVLTTFSLVTTLKNEEFCIRFSENVSYYLLVGHFF